MVKVTVDLVRKKAEHHDRQLAPLEEIALHQENIEKIEYIQDWCPKLKILLFQSNLISKIENLNKLKHLEYLNLALNNIEKIENLERCESLQKLDLTINFIGDIFSISNLVDNYNLKTLFLVGNPCADYDGYRDFVIATLPQLNYFDGVDIERSERIKAFQSLPIIRDRLIEQHQKYSKKREEQRVRLEKSIERKWMQEIPEEEEEERNRRYWQEKCEHAPEVRLEMERQRELKNRLQDKTKKTEGEKPPRRLFAPDGRAFNINEGQLKFHFDDSDFTQFVLSVNIFRHLDTSLLEVDVQPTYVRVMVKGKIFQICLPEEVDVSASSVVRSQTTGLLVIRLPKPLAILYGKKPKEVLQEKESLKSTVPASQQTRREFLEIGSSVPLSLDIVNGPKENNLKQTKQTSAQYEKQPSADFIDDPTVPDLI